MILDKLIKNPYGVAMNMPIEELEEFIKKSSYAYHSTGKSLVDDATYDILVEVLEKRNPKSGILKKVGAEVKGAIQLPYYMGSLDKVKPSSDKLEHWIKKYEGPYVLSDKMDGVSGLLIKQNGKLILYTRGDGTYGNDISELIPYVIPKIDIPNDMAIRGELIISKKNFKKIEHEMKNARNAVAGLVNSKTKSPKIAQLVDYVTYEIVNPRTTYSEQFELLDKLGFKTSHYKKVTKLSNEFLKEYLIKRKNECDYEMDGIVVMDDSKIHKLVKDKNPSYGFAFKTILSDQIAETEVVDVIWKASKDRLMKPKIKIKPVELLGTTITYATAHNAKFIVDNVIGKGSKIKIIRSGDVIPYIYEIITSSSSGKPQMPNVKYVWNDTNVDIIVDEPNKEIEKEITGERLKHFFKKLDVKFISGGIIDKLVEEGYDTIPKILKASNDELASIDGLGNKMIEKIKTNINKSFANMSLTSFMDASHKFGRGLGEKKFKVLLNEYPTLFDDYEKIPQSEIVSKIEKVQGFDNLSAKKIYGGIKKFLEFYDSINNIIDISHIWKFKKEMKKHGIFENKIIVFTGFRDAKLKEYIENNGGEVTDSVSKNTSLVISLSKEDDSNKVRKAKELNIPLTTKDEFIKKLNITM